MNKKQKMNTKNLLVSFLTIVSILFVVATVSAVIALPDNTSNDYTITDVKVNGMDATGNDVSVIAGETTTVKVYFTANIDASDVRFKAEIEGDKVDVDAMTGSFDIENGSRYSKILTLKVPSELKDEVNGTVTLSLKIWGGESEKYTGSLDLKVQRPSYFADIKSVTVSNSVEAGEKFPVDIVLKNMGYNDLDDVYVTAKISALDVEKTAYFGDLVVEEVNGNDDEDTANGRLYLEVPYSAESGVYALEVVISNDDTTTKVTKQIVVNNDFSSNVIVTSQSKTVATSEDAEYSLLIVNPTNKLKVYKIVLESSGDFSADAKDSVVAIPAGSSRTVGITANAISEGEYSFNANIFSGDKLVETVTLGLNAEGKSVTSPIVVLTVILAIIFLVLLVVLIILLGKKPEKSAEDFGESYY